MNSPLFPARTILPRHFSWRHFPIEPNRVARLSNKMIFIFFHAGCFSIQRSVILSKFGTVKIQALNKIKNVHEAFSFYPFKFSIAFADEANPAVLFAVAARNRFFPRFCSPFSLPQKDGVF
jgi:hypothetical protein